MAGLVGGVNPKGMRSRCADLPTLAFHASVSRSMPARRSTRRRVADLDPGAYELEFAEACHSTHVNCMGDYAYTPTPDQHRERARLLRSQADSMSPEGKRLFLNIADEFDQLADSIDPARFN